MGDARQQVRGLKEQVDVRVPEHQPASLRRDEAVFHGMGHTHSDGEADDACRAFERVGRAHACLELVRQRVVAFERQQARGEHLCLRLGFHAEEIEHRKLTEIDLAHPRLRLSE